MYVFLVDFSNYKVSNPAISRQWGKDRIVITTHGTYIVPVAICDTYIS